MNRYYEITLTDVDKHWLVSTTKAVHDGMKGSLGFKECKDIVYAVHEGDEKVLYDGSDFVKATLIMQELDSVNAQYVLNGYHD